MARSVQNVCDETTKIKDNWKSSEKESKSASKDLKRTWYIGYVIEQEVEEVKRYINNVLNYLYDADKLPSGRNFQWNLWCTESVKKAKQSAYQKITQRKMVRNQHFYVMSWPYLTQLKLSIWSLEEI